MKILASIILLACTPLLAQQDYNFVIFLVDDLGWADVSPNKPDTNYETPNIQKLAERSINFPQSYAPNPVCSPSRYGLQTGKYPTRGGITNWIGGKSRTDTKFDDAPYNRKGLEALNETTFAKLLQDKGYKTQISGKWHLGGDPKNFGYDEAEGIHGFSKGKTGDRYFGPFVDYPNSTEDDYLPELNTDKTVEFIEKHKNEKFFAFRSFHLVHLPLEAKEELVEKYRAKFKKMGLPENAVAGRVGLQCDPTYAAMIEAMDTCVGQIMDTLEKNNLLEKTVVIFASDNGGELLSTSNLPLRSAKWYPYEGGVRVPIMISNPNLKAKGDAYKNTYVNLIDLYPTICELAGIKFDHKIDGVSLLPLIEGDENFAKRDMFWHFPHYRNPKGKPSGAIRSGDWKLIENYEDGSLELYNLKEDLGELKDIAKEHPQKVQELKEKLHAWYKDVGAKFIQAKESTPDLKPWRPE